MELNFEVKLKILKPHHEVFEGVYKPENLCRYFTKTATPLNEGGVAKWTFPEFTVEIPVYTRQVIANELIVFEWEAQDGAYNTKVEMRFEPIGKDMTMFNVKESGWKENPKGFESSYGNCQGWMHMACCLKAYLEYGINLRAGGAI
jgi:uncharacterized protein YndB with AHSA1/START domain